MRCEHVKSARDGSLYFGIFCGSITRALFKYYFFLVAPIESLVFLVST